LFFEQDRRDDALAIRAYLALTSFAISLTARSDMHHFAAVQFVCVWHLACMRGPALMREQLEAKRTCGARSRCIDRWRMTLNGLREHS
jgi:hypothetical protein